MDYLKRWKLLIESKRPESDSTWFVAYSYRHWQTVYLIVVLDSNGFKMFSKRFRGLFCRYDLMLRMTSRTV